MEALKPLIDFAYPLLGNIWFQIALLVFFATVHGYLGAWLAVRMLFRPRSPIKILGITIFPQGMIPRHRERLANAIGRAVGEELVSQDTLLDELFEKDFLRRKVEGLIDSFAEELLQTNYPSLLEALPAPAREPFLDAISALQIKIGEHISGILKNEETAETINGFVERRVNEIFSAKVSETIDDETFEKVLGFLEKRISASIKEPSLEQKIRDFIGRRVDDIANMETPLGEMFTEDAVFLFKERVNQQIEPMAHQLAEIATAEKTRNQIGALIKKEVHTYYEGLPFFKKVFVSRESLIKEVDDLVNETLPKRLEEVLRGDYFAEEAKSFLDSSIDGILKRPLPEIIGQIAPEKMATLKEQVARNILKLLQSEEMRISLSAYLADTIHKIRPHSLRAILAHAHPDVEPKLKKMLSSGLANMLSREETSQLVNSVVSKQIERFLVMPIGKLSDHFSEEQVKGIGRKLSETILAAAREKLPEAIREFDIGGVVRDKVNNYPAEKLEALILSVAKEHLRTIELFGALFGFIIGVVQGILHWAFPK